MNITIDGKNYALDLERAKELGVIKETVYYKIGDKFRIEGETYVLAAMPEMSGYLLVNIITGCHWGGYIPEQNEPLAHDILAKHIEDDFIFLPRL